MQQWSDTWSVIAVRVFFVQLLQREIEARTGQFASAVHRCSSWNPRFGSALENRYHRLLLRVLEWTFHLETLAKKPPVSQSSPFSCVLFSFLLPFKLALFMPRP